MRDFVVVCREEMVAYPWRVNTVYPIGSLIAFFSDRQEIEHAISVGQNRQFSPGKPYSPHVETDISYLTVSL
jgi:hypothetical protein